VSWWIDWIYTGDTCCLLARITVSVSVCLCVSVYWCHWVAAAAAARLSWWYDAFCGCLQANVLIVDLFDDLRDGFSLLTLLEVLSHQTFVRQW